MPSTPLIDRSGNPLSPKRHIIDSSLREVTRSDESLKRSSSFSPNHSMNRTLFTFHYSPSSLNANMPLDTSFTEILANLLLKPILDDKKYFEPPYILSNDLNTILPPNPSSDFISRAHLILDAVNEALTKIFTPQLRYLNPSFEGFKKSMIKPPALTGQSIKEKTMSLVLSWATYPDREGENLDAFLIEEVKDEEKKWKDLEYYESQIKNQLCDDLFDSMLMETISILDQIDLKKQRESRPLKVE